MALTRQGSDALSLTAAIGGDFTNKRLSTGADLSLTSDLTLVLTSSLTSDLTAVCSVCLIIFGEKLWPLLNLLADVAV